MNCANHPDRERSAFCQNCGKPLCNECIRNVGSSVFCEQCAAARTATPPPSAGYPYPGSAGYPPVATSTRLSEPNPGLAALLGFIPGVGAMYNEQYAKGVVHLIVFAVLVSLSHDVEIFGIFVAGWIFYMVIEAHHTARARRDGTPLPDPFGLNELSERLGFGKAWPGGVPPANAAGGPAYQPQDPAAPNVPPAGAYAPPYTYAPPVAQWEAPQDSYANYAVPPVPPIPPVPPVPGSTDPIPYYRRFPSGAIWMIGMGLFFLFGNVGIFHSLHGRFFGPLLLIGVGVWLFVRKMLSTGHGLENDGSAFYRWRVLSAVNCSFWVLLTGFIWLLDELRILSWGHSWPLYLIAVGVMMFFKRTMLSDYPMGYPSGQPFSPPTAAPVTSTAIVPADSRSLQGHDAQEGR
jgi:B-box zinc finger